MVLLVLAQGCLQQVASDGRGGAALPGEGPGGGGRGAAGGERNTIITELNNKGLASFFNPPFLRKFESGKHSEIEWFCSFYRVLVLVSGL